MMILPDIYLLSGFAYQIHQNVYGIAIQNEKRLVLIDTGLDGRDIEQIRKTMKVWGLDGYKITEIFLTHAHFDHTGNASYFEKQGATLYAGNSDADSIETGDEHTIGYAYGRDFPTCQNVKRQMNRERLYLAEDYEVECYHTPGHTEGSMCYELHHGGRRILFTGDFVQTGEAVIGVRVDSSYCYKKYLSSVLQMEQIESDVLLPGHFHPYLKPARHLIQAAHRELLVNRDRYSDL